MYKRQPGGNAPKPGHCQSINELRSSHEDDKGVAQRTPKRSTITMSLALQLGDEVPNFVAQSTVGRFVYHDMIDGMWSVLISVAGVYDAVATTELGYISKLHDEFAARNTRLMVIVPQAPSETVRQWITEVEHVENCRVNVPVIVDADCEVAKLLGLVHITTGRTANLVLVADIDRRIRLSLVSNTYTGRNMYEMLRAIDTIQLSFFHQVATPANWSYGDDVLVHRNLSSVSARAIFPKGVVESRPWFRTTPQPDNPDR